VAIANVGEVLGDGDERKQEEETRKEPEMQYGKSNESTGGRKGGGGSRTRGREMNYFDAVPKDA